MWNGNNRRHAAFHLSAAQEIDMLRETGHRRQFEQLAQRQIDIEVVSQPCDDATRQERTAARIEKVIVHSNFLQFKDVSPHLRYQFLNLRTRLDESLMERRPLAVWRRQRVAVDLTVRC